jgi:hypothetical protein
MIWNIRASCGEVQYIFSFIIAAFCSLIPPHPPSKMAAYPENKTPPSTPSALSVPFLDGRKPLSVLIVGGSLSGLFTGILLQRQVRSNGQKGVLWDRANRCSGMQRSETI